MFSQEMHVMLSLCVQIELQRARGASLLCGLRASCYLCFLLSPGGVLLPSVLAAAVTAIDPVTHSTIQQSSQGFSKQAATMLACRSLVNEGADKRSHLVGIVMLAW